MFHLFTLSVTLVLLTQYDVLLFKVYAHKVKTNPETATLLGFSNITRLTYTVQDTTHSLGV